MCNPLVLDNAVHRLRFHPTQADVGPSNRCYRPGEAPPVGVEHGQGPQVHSGAIHPCFQGLPQCVQVGSPGVVLHPLRRSRRSRRVVDCDGVQLNSLLEWGCQCQEIFVVRAGDIISLWSCIGYLNVGANTWPWRPLTIGANSESNIRTLAPEWLRM